MSVLGALLVFLLFVQGGQSMLVHHPDEGERRLLIHSLGRKWELTFTTLVTFGGAFFASFPLFYSTSFGGAYWLWMLILFSFVVQAVSYQYRSKSGNVYGRGFYDVLLLINGIAGPLLLGVAVAGMFFGAEFSVEKSNILHTGSATISTWGPLHGLEAIGSWRNLLFGAMVLMLARTLASLYFLNNIDDRTVNVRQRRLLRWNAALFVVLFLATVAVLLTADGVRVSEGKAEVESCLYLHNFLDLWWVLLVFVAGVALVLFGIGKTLLSRWYNKGIWWAGIGTIFVVLALFWVLGYNDTAYYPSLIDVQSSLTIRNSCSSEFTLTVMSVVSVLVPFVVAYIAYCWHLMDRNKLTRGEVADSDH